MAMTARQRARVSLYIQIGIFVVAVAALVLAIDWKTVGNSVFNFAKIGPMFPDIFLVGLKNTLIYTALGFVVGLSGGLLLALMKLSTLPAVPLDRHGLHRILPRRPGPAGVHRFRLRRPAGVSASSGTST